VPVLIQNHLLELSALRDGMRRLAPFDLPAAATKGEAAVELIGRSEFLRFPEISNSLEKIAAGLKSGSSASVRDALGNLDRLIDRLPASIDQAKKIRQDRYCFPSLSSAAMAVSREDNPPSLVKKVRRLFDNGREKEAVEEIRQASLLASQGNSDLFREVVRLTYEDDIFHLVREGIGLGWPAFLLRMIDPKGGFALSKRKGAAPSSETLKYEVLAWPPALPASIEVLTDIARKPAPNARSQYLRQRALHGLLFLTTPKGRSLLDVMSYWSLIREIKPQMLPVILASDFEAAVGRAAWWGLYGQHVGCAMTVAEDESFPLLLRRSALETVWEGYAGGARAPHEIWKAAAQKTLRIAKKDPNLVWPLIGRKVYGIAAMKQASPKEMKELLLNQIEDQGLSEIAREAIVEALLILERAYPSRRHLRAAWNSNGRVKEIILKAAIVYPSVRGRLVVWTESAGFENPFGSPFKTGKKR
jgi:hypothetical protein